MRLGPMLCPTASGLELLDHRRPSLCAQSLSLHRLQCSLQGGWAGKHYGARGWMKRTPRGG